MEARKTYPCEKHHHLMVQGHIDCLYHRIHFSLGAVQPANGNKSKMSSELVHYISAEWMQDKLCNGKRKEKRKKEETKKRKRRKERKKKSAWSHSQRQVYTCIFRNLKIIQNFLLNNLTHSLNPTWEPKMESQVCILITIINIATIVYTYSTAHCALDVVWDHHHHVPCKCPVTFNAISMSSSSSSMIHRKEGRKEGNF